MSEIKEYQVYNIGNYTVSLQGLAFDGSIEGIASCLSITLIVFLRLHPSNTINYILKLLAAYGFIFYYYYYL